MNDAVHITAPEEADELMDEMDAGPTRGEVVDELPLELAASVVRAALHGQEALDDDRPMEPTPDEAHLDRVLLPMNVELGEHP